MIVWTVVIKTVGRIDFGGEFPYEVRAFTREEAMSKARAIHKERYPRFNHARAKVRQVVQWGALV